MGGCHYIIKMVKVCILNINSGNTGSLSNMLNHLKIKNTISRKKETINAATHYILPGVGSFNEVMKNFKKYIPIKTLEKNILKKKKPLLGICVGMQILANYGYENKKTTGLGWINGEVKMLKNKILPHMGWNNVKIKDNSKNFFRQNQDEFYFVHSYHFITKNNKNCLGISSYGQEFCSIISQDNILGVQFHPEKSQVAGLNFLKRYFR